jgi:hypothetical protein
MAVVSFDGEWVYYSYIYDLQNHSPWNPPKAGADIYRIHLKTRRIGTGFAFHRTESRRPVVAEIRKRDSQSQAGTNRRHNPRPPGQRVAD